MSDLTREISRGQRAKDILDDELFIESLEILKESYSNAIFQTGPNDELARTKIYLAYQILGKFENHFRSVTTQEKIAPTVQECFK